ncbi:hypothetical protein [Rhodohalobacter sulfatireducens]|uniref:Uncharacterized protein n=1 Tax=Rhodohalobacter sulfatireducens TaxID=2911366 RepID=A0ABS9K9Z1_9BACT|nr:hypothetical protein [Rhodohalobacter sulfatireducens]MCG2587669.1 hypothetical protein [Rhodohalobacter sulfatireducens]
MNRSAKLVGSEGDLLGQDFDSRYSRTGKKETSRGSKSLEVLTYEASTMDAVIYALSR